MTSESFLFTEYKRIEKQLEALEDTISILRKEKIALKRKIKETALWKKMLCKECTEARENHIFGLYCDTDDNLDILNQRKEGEVKFYTIKENKS